MGCKASNLCATYAVNTIPGHRATQASRIPRESNLNSKIPEIAYNSEKTNEIRHHNGMDEADNATGEFFYNNNVKNRKIDISLDTTLRFDLSRRSDHSSLNCCTLNLKHPGTTQNHIAFKVKSIQSRRYIARPNRGIVAPNCNTSVTILVSEEEKQMLLHAFDRLGPSVFDQCCKHMFLVQSCLVDDDYSNSCSEKKRRIESRIWNAVNSGNISIYKNKLQVRHTVVNSADGGDDVTMGGTVGDEDAGPCSVQPRVPRMTAEQILAEIAFLRREYNEICGGNGDRFNNEGVGEMEEGIVEAMVVMAEEEVYVMDDDIVEATVVRSQSSNDDA